jgi:hypothetical protein
MKGLILLLRRFHFVLVLLCWSQAHSLHAENLTRQSEIAKEVERLRDLDGIFAWVLLDAESLHHNTNSPVNRLFELAKGGQPDGMMGVNDLLPYLTNTSPTGLMSYSTRQERPYQVNEVIAEIITRVAGHHFYIASGDNIVLHLRDCASITNANIIGWFHDQIEQWCLRYGNYPVENRKIVDLNDWFHYNRFDSCRWLGKAKSAKGRVPIERRIDYLLNETPLRLDTLMQSEMVVCAKALASIGDQRSADSVKKVCDHLWHNPIHASGRIQELYDAYQAWAKFGNKAQALEELQSYKNKYEAKLEPSMQRELQDRLRDAEGW